MKLSMATSAHLAAWSRSHDAPLPLSPLLNISSGCFHICQSVLNGYVRVSYDAGVVDQHENESVRCVIEELAGFGGQVTLPGQDAVHVVHQMVRENPE